MLLTAKDALAEGVVEVSAEARPPLEHSEALYAVFTAEEPKAFLGLVAVGEIGGNPGRIFADLLPKPQLTIREDTPLDQVWLSLKQARRECVAVVDERGNFCGAVTRFSLTQALLAENRRLTQRLFVQQEEERRDLARELHDEVGQHLAALRAELGCLALALGEEFQPQLEAIGKTVERLCFALQQVVHRLRPVVLHQLGLVAALHELVAEYRRCYPWICFKFKAVGDGKGLSEERALAVYRVAQECLTNAVRHAQASRVTVTFRATPLCLTVSDDGRGLSRSQGGLGLLGMRERIEALGGTLTLSSQPKRGTQVSVKLPA
jgi:signal transduction histidine kinase